MGIMIAIEIEVCDPLTTFQMGHASTRDFEDACATRPREKRLRQEFDTAKEALGLQHR